MKHDATQRTYNDNGSRSVEFLIDGRPYVYVYQVLRSPVDFKAEAPTLRWSATREVDADFAEAMGDALKQAAEILRQWEAETIQAVA